MAFQKGADLDYRVQESHVGGPIQPIGGVGVSSNIKRRQK
jgi:hypothetical protein